MRSNESKKTRALELSDTAWEAIAAVAKEQGLSESELVEKWAKKLGAALKIVELNRATINRVNSLTKD